MNKIRVFSLSAFAVIGSAFQAAANAAVPEGVITAITTAGVDAGTVGAAVFVVIVGIAAFKYMRRAM